MKLKDRLKNYGFWVALFALIPLICQAFHILKIPDNYDNLVNGILAFLVAAGIANNPTTDSKGFSDDKEDDKSSGQ